LFNLELFGERIYSYYLAALMDNISGCNYHVEVKHQ
jgi:hypothetical protein